MGARFLAAIRSKRLARYRKRFLYLGRQQLLAMALFVIVGTALTVVSGLERFTSEPGDWLQLQDGRTLTKALAVLFFLCVSAFYSWRGLLAKKASSVPRKRIALTSLLLGGLSVLAIANGPATLLAGAYLVAVGLLMTELLDMRGEFRERRGDSLSSYAPSPLFTLTVPRSHELLGALLVVVGLTLIGATFAHWVVGLASASMLASLIIMKEFSLWRSGDRRKMAPFSWSFPTSIALISGVLYLVLLGLVMDEDFLLVDTGLQSQTPLLLQAALGAQGAIWALSLAAIGLVIQLRASSFGTDVATQLYNWRGLVLLAGCLGCSLVFTALVLGNWSTWGSDSNYAGLSLVLAFGFVALMMVAVGRLVLEFSNSRSILDPVANLALSPKLQDELKMFAWNPNSSRFFPPAAQFLSLVLIGAWRQGDIGLYTDLLDRWRWNIERQPFSQSLNPPLTLMNDYKGQLQWKKDLSLGVQDADAFDGLDIALARSIRSTASAIRYDNDYLYKLAELCQLIYPPPSAPNVRATSLILLAGASRISLGQASG